MTDEAFYFRGILQQEQGRYDEALQSYKLAIQFRPRLASEYDELMLCILSFYTK